MRITYIAPTDPGKGGLGIINYIAQLTKVLKRKESVMIIGFKQLYPWIKFPRLSSPIATNFRVYNVLSTYNPYTWAKAAMMVNKFPTDIIHFHWWSSVLTPAYIALLTLLKKHKTVITLHNPISHEQSFLFRSIDRLNRIMLNLTDEIIVDTFSVKKLLANIYPKLNNKVTVVPIGNLVLRKTAKISSIEAKKKLGVATDLPCVLFFGYVRQYKGLSYLIRAVKDVKCSLLIAGIFIDQLEQYVNQIRRLGITEQVKIFPHVIPEDQVPLFFKAADIVALPYTQMCSSSGVVHSAIEFNKCIIVTKCSTFNELFTHNENAYLVEPKNPNELQKAIVELIQNTNKQKSMRKNVKKLAEKFTWLETAKLHSELYGNMLTA